MNKQQTQIISCNHITTYPAVVVAGQILPKLRTTSEESFAQRTEWYNSYAKFPA